MDTKKCTKCSKQKSFDSFYKRKQGVAKLFSECKKCTTIINRKATHKYNLNKKYGITPAQYKEMAAAQGECCTLCGTHQDDLERLMAVDHDHATGKIRALLCFGCNTALGKFGDDPSLLRKAADYVESHRIKEAI